VISNESLSDLPAEFFTVSVIVYVVPAVLPAKSRVTLTADEPAMPPLNVHLYETALLDVAPLNDHCSLPDFVHVRSRALVILATGAGIGVGFGVGFAVGAGVGTVVGRGVGLAVRSGAGRALGVTVGPGVGLGVGLGVGSAVGGGLGASVGSASPMATSGCEPSGVPVTDATPPKSPTGWTVKSATADTQPTMSTTAASRDSWWRGSTRRRACGR
jgi:hypothetical protein